MSTTPYDTDCTDGDMSDCTYVHQDCAIGMHCFKLVSWERA